MEPGEDRGPLAPGETQKQRKMKCDNCGNWGHSTEKCRKGKVGKEKNTTTKSAASSSRSNSPGPRGKAAAKKIQASVADGQVRDQEAMHARVQRRLEQAEQARDEARQELERMQDPFERLTGIVNVNEEIFENVLRRRPMGGVGSVEDLLRYINDLRALDARDAARGLTNLALGLISGREGEFPGEVDWALPETYEEEIEVLVYRRGIPVLQKFASFVAAIGALDFSYKVFYEPAMYLLDREWFSWGGYLTFAAKHCRYMNKGGTYLAFGLSAGLYYLGTRTIPTWTTVTARHSLDYDPLDAADQVRLSADRRNMTFRAAQVMESSFGVRVHHTVSLFEEEENRGVNIFFKRSGKIGEAVRHIVDRIWWISPPSARTLVPVPEGTVLWNPECERSLLVQDVMHPREVRNRLLSTVPSVNGDVIDLTLFHWQATNPDVMEPSGEFSEKFRTVRRNLKTNGSVANDLRPAIYAMLYPSTAHVIMIHWLWAKSRSSGQQLAVQPWGL